MTEEGNARVGEFFAGLVREVLAAGWRYDRARGVWARPVCDSSGGEDGRERVGGCGAARVRVRAVGDGGAGEGVAPRSAVVGAQALGGEDRPGARLASVGEERAGRRAACPGPELSGRGLPPLLAGFGSGFAADVRHVEGEW